MRWDEHGERITLDHDLEHLAPGRPSLALPPLLLDGPGARPALTASTIGDDIDVVTALKRPAKAALEEGVRSADDHAHPRWAVALPLRHAEDAQDELGDESHRPRSDLGCWPHPCRRGAATRHRRLDASERRRSRPLPQVPADNAYDQLEGACEVESGQNILGVDDRPGGVSKAPSRALLPLQALPEGLGLGAPEPRDQHLLGALHQPSGLQRLPRVTAFSPEDLELSETLHRGLDGRHETP